MPVCPVRSLSFDLPVTAGLFPLFLQNGIWANDAILGGAASLTAKNSQKLGLSNYDVTFFAAFDNVDNALFKSDVSANRNNNIANLYGVTAFIDAFGGYVEAGYGLVQGDRRPCGRPADELRDGRLHPALCQHLVELDPRASANFGDGEEDDGFLVISENSIISGLPSTLLPYANFFFGIGNPQPLVDGNGAGLLKNVGISFETDALTGFPKLNDTGSNAYGGAIGLQYLFNLDQQLVFELATVQPFGDVDPWRRRRGRRSTPRAFAIRSRSTRTGCSAPMRPIRSSITPTSRTISASAPSSAGSSDARA